MFEPLGDGVRLPKSLVTPYLYSSSRRKMESFGKHRSREAFEWALKEESEGRPLEEVALQSLWRYALFQPEMLTTFLGVLQKRRPLRGSEQTLRLLSYSRYPAWEPAARQLMTTVTHSPDSPGGWRPSGMTAVALLQGAAHQGSSAVEDRLGILWALGFRWRHSTWSAALQAWSTAGDWASLWSQWEEVPAHLRKELGNEFLRNALRCPLNGTATTKSVTRAFNEVQGSSLSRRTVAELLRAARRTEDAHPHRRWWFTFWLRASRPNERLWRERLALVGIRQGEEIMWKHFAERATLGPVGHATFHTLLFVYARRGNLKGCWRVLEKMELEGVQPNEGSLCKILAGVSTPSELEYAVRVLEEFQERNISPTSRTLVCLQRLLERCQNSSSNIRASEVTRKTIFSALRSLDKTNPSTVELANLVKKLFPKA